MGDSLEPGYPMTMYGQTHSITTNNTVVLYHIPDPPPSLRVEPPLGASPFLPRRGTVVFTADEDFEISVAVPYFTYMHFLDLNLYFQCQLLNP